MLNLRAFLPLRTSKSCYPKCPKRLRNISEIANEKLRYSQSFEMQCAICTWRNAQEPTSLSRRRSINPWLHPGLCLFSPANKPAIVCVTRKIVVPLCMGNFSSSRRAPGQSKQLKSPICWNSRRKVFDVPGSDQKQKTLHFIWLDTTMHHYVVEALRMARNAMQKPLDKSLDVRRMYRQIILLFIFCLEVREMSILIKIVRLGEIECQSLACR